jgi:hypothetical protein
MANHMCFLTVQMPSLREFSSQEGSVKPQGSAVPMMAAAITTTAATLSATLAAVSTMAAPIMTAGPAKAQSMRTNEPPYAAQVRCEPAPAYRALVQGAEPANKAQVQRDAAYGTQAKSDLAFRAQAQDESLYMGQQGEAAYRQILPKNVIKQVLLAEPSVRPLQVR